jgi:hypothetical protein
MLLTVHFLGANIPLKFTVSKNYIERVTNMITFGKSGAFRSTEGNRIFINIDHVLYMQLS